MNENNELGAGPFANEGTKGLPVVAWLSDFDALADRLEIAGWRSCADAQSDGVRALLAEWTEAIAQRDAELAELREQNALLKEAGERVDDDYQATISALQAELAAMREQKPIYQTCDGVNGWLDVDLLRYTACGLEPEEFDTRVVYADPVSAPSQVAAEVVQVPRDDLKVLRDVTEALRRFMRVFGCGEVRDCKALDAADALLATRQEQAE